MERSGIGRRAVIKRAVSACAAAAAARWIRPAAGAVGAKGAAATVTVNLGETDRHDPAGALRPVRRAHRRRDLRRDLGRSRLEDPEHRRHPARH